ncbi:MAG: signal recognition particle-docking protein FtsY [Thermoplasmatales archaeon]|nr:signal recognition particle-docking protein FtsY [Thermoplasmatales archaeon]
MFQFLKKKLKKTEETIEEEKKKGLIGISEKKIDELLWQIEIDLIEADVAFEVIEEIKREIKNSLIGLSRREAKEEVGKIIKDAIYKILKESEGNFFEEIKKFEKPVVILFVGVNGSGKTTAIAKLAWQLKNMGYSCVIAACDTFRAGAIEQLERHAEKIGVKLIKHDFGSDPAAVAYDAIEHAKARHKDFVLIDTAGRMQTNINLMEEMKKIKRVAKPNLVIFVGDALVGNDAIEQAKKFNDAVGIDGVILSKVDADAKGGASISIAYSIKRPLYFIGIGQNYEEQMPFNADWMIKRIFEE